MAYASVTYTSASGTTFALTNSSGNAIQYLRQADIAVTVNGVLKTQGTDYTFNSAGTAIVLGTAVSGATVVITRTTDIADASVSFTAGSTLTAQDLNNSDKQNRFALQEFSDTYGALTTGSGDLSALAGFIGSSETWLSDNAHAPTTGAVDNRVDSKITTNNANVILRNGSQAMQAALSLGGFKITNLATPTASTDASTKAYVDSNVGAVSASATAAAASAAAAATSETNAASSASSASTSASNASTSASNAASSASSASTSASNAATSASNASTSATSAANSATSAASSAASALAAFDSFDDRYLGAKASDPTVDNDGDPLNAGDLYYNTTSSVMKVYTGSVWVVAYVPGDATNISFTPYSTTGAVNVQAAIQELTDEKLNLTGGTLTGALGITGGTAASPSVFISGDTNTGFYSPGADQVAISTNGTGRLFVSSTGQIGIGGAPSGSSLNIIDPVPIIRLTDSDTSGYSHVLQSDTSLYLDADRGAAGTGALIVRTNGTNERLRITSAGLVGIGNSSPGSYNASSDDLVVGDHVGAHGVTICSQNNSSGYIMFADGTTGAQTYAGQITYDHANNRLTLGTNDGTTGLTIDSSQRVGVGTTSPAGKLTVSGNAIGTTVALTDAATVAVDLSLANYYTLTLGGNRTLGAPTNQTAGQSGVIVITQDGTGSRTLAYNSVYKFPSGTAPTLTTTANAVDVLVYYVESATRITCRLLSDLK